MSSLREPVPFEVYESGVYLHGTKADLAVGDLLLSGRESNFEAGRVMNYVYFTATLDAAVWGAELASGDGAPNPRTTTFNDPRGRCATALRTRRSRRSVGIREL
jgi:hypothetical protein